MITIRKAISSDSEALIKLTAITPMKGKISLRIDRQPNFFRLLGERGDYFVVVAEDENKQIVGSFSSARQEFYAQGNKTPVFYLCDFKVHPRYTGSTLAYKLVKEMYRQLKAVDADMVLCTTASGNKAVMPFFDGRTNIPAFRKMSRFSIYQLVPKATNATVDPYKGSIRSLNDFYSKFYTRYQFSPEIRFTYDCVHFAEQKEGEIEAAITLYDPSNIKQNVVIDYPWNIALTLSILRKAKALLRLPALPSKGEPLRLLYVRFYAFKAHREDALVRLIRIARSYAFVKGYHFLAIAVSEKDQQLNYLLKYRSLFVFESTTAIASLHNNDQLLNTICEGLPYEDYSLV